MGAGWRLAGSWLMLDRCWLDVGYVLNGCPLNVGWMLDGCWLDVGWMLDGRWMGPYVLTNNG